jgi:prolyl-tRNA editing enzyme YbaK/EbsC (Cys-tRNA(Pro) deacylase)
VHPTAEKVQRRLRDLGVDADVRELDQSTRTAAEAAAAIGCEVAQIVKSLVLFADGAPFLCLIAGDRRVDITSIGQGARMATAEEAHEATGFGIGGLPPFGHDCSLRTIVDGSLRRFPVVWCAAGTPRAVFAIEPERLIAAIPNPDVRADVTTS